MQGTSQPKSGRKSRSKQYVPEGPPAGTMFCAADGCGAEALYKAPKSPRHLHEYQWFCLDHIREFNQKWDYFRGMNSGEIEAFQKDALFGHRPTWRPDDTLRHTPEHLHDALHHFLHAEAPATPQHPALPPALRRAFEALELTPTRDKAALKKQYKLLVKRTHPDTATESTAPERFKAVVEAYHTLLARFDEILAILP